ncbi:golgin subfamily A member 6-like protein 22 [Etheostoma spectabile]|uniref:golgin subfamily A member 6-like protein 22 n=1 Tax=Etheostoma spectabile TaxID=54343 RepID=UPI0013AF7949|nr:golgin subfamily A member 6-like protein 22 [Etheostoma spectabile]
MATMTVKDQNKDLKKDQRDTQELINQLVSQNAGLEEEKLKLLTALRSERTIRKNARKENKIKEMEKNVEIESLKKSLEAEKKISLSAKVHWSGEFNRIVGVFKQEQEKIRETQENRFNEILSAMQGQNLITMDAKLRTLAEDSERKVSQVIREKDELIHKITEENTALEVKYLESNAELMEKERRIIQSEAEVGIKLTALKDEMSRELAAKEESFQTRQQLERENREKEWVDNMSHIKNDFKFLQEQISALRQQTHDLQECEKMSRRMEEEWTEKESQMENKIQILIAQNSELQVSLYGLQELAQKTDKEKARMRKEEEKAKKEAEQSLKKERKKAKEREEKQEEENRKREKEELKRQKKEKEEMEKQVKKERKEREKRKKEGFKRQKNEKEARVIEVSQERQRVNRLSSEG